MEFQFKEKRNFFTMHANLCWLSKVFTFFIYPTWCNKGIPISWLHWLLKHVHNVHDVIIYCRGVYKELLILCICEGTSACLHTLQGPPSDGNTIKQNHVQIEAFILNWQHNRYKMLDIQTVNIISWIPSTWKLKGL